MKIIFKKDKKDGEIIAFMPYDIQNWKGNFTCYAHLGQHGVCNYDYYLDCKKATKEEYQNLYNELKNIGYEIEIIQKINGIKKRKAYKEFLNRYVKA